MTPTIPADFSDRLALAHEAAAVRYEKRDGFISDDDLLDIAADFTTSDMSWLGSDDVDPLSDEIDDADYRALLNALVALVWPDAD